MKSNWNYPTTVWVGNNRIIEINSACKNLKIKKPLFVTDKDLIGLDFVKQMKPYTYKWDKRHKYVDWDKNPDTDLKTWVGGILNFSEATSRLRADGSTTPIICSASG